MGTVPNGRFPEVGSEKGQYWKWVPLLEMGMPFPVWILQGEGVIQFMITFSEDYPSTQVTSAPPAGGPGEPMLSVDQRRCAAPVDFVQTHDKRRNSEKGRKQ